MKDNDIIKALEYCADGRYCGDCGYDIKSAKCIAKIMKDSIDLINRQKAEIERLRKFKSYFDDLYGKGLEVSNWHLNGDLEQFDNFYESALDV